MSRTASWKIDPIADGIVNIKLSSWKYFGDFINKEMREYNQYVWRGHRRADWTLKSSLYRFLQKSGKSVDDSAYSQHLDSFKYASRGRRGSNPPGITTDDDWWALGQHFGLATPLLDWTEVPFAALYFAFEKNQSPNKSSRAVFGLAAASIEDKSTEIQRKYNVDKFFWDNAHGQKKNVSLRNLYDQFSPLPDVPTGESSQQVTHTGDTSSTTLFPLPIAAVPPQTQTTSISPQPSPPPPPSTPSPIPPPPVEPKLLTVVRPQSDENARLVSQRGLFTRVPVGLTIEDWVKQNFLGSKIWILVKIEIPDVEREQCLKYLNRMNINHLSLFPDLFGASSYCNMNLEIQNY